MDNPSTKIVAIGSGKGGVGKSTVAVNLAVALAQTGLKIGLLDADIYGPSIPIMLGLRRLTPKIFSQADGKSQVLPFTKFGIKAISIGFFMEEARSAVWRGPILHGALEKMLNEVAWGELDVLLIDLPPGTGDVLLSLSQLLAITGALVVCTPQEVAMLDAIKAINAFYQLDIPLLGVVENMAGFAVPETGQIYHIFGEGKAQELADRFHLPLLASLPLLPAIRQGGDEGYPIAFHEGHPQAALLFRTLAQAVARQWEPLANPFL
ncbi:Mrp/NBP35 family ATP-binding protein [Candidatus Protochlamydia phocaeensis]|uniref:Mrp/NBP35 family ATP-binding protein n=1 Tax=Candidatus Protochlamydia phocaeensis TaxID=1414722 RepID=UPI00083825BD|nr:Mrp/NBP35 family ATP-binding protein [Candidatus Protochlamydia phocaeensis]